MSSMTAAPPAPLQDGVHAPVPRERMTEGARKLRDAYARVPGAPLYRKRCLELGG